MYSTDQFRIFTGAPADRLLSRPRRLLQEGRTEDAEEAYQTLLSATPDLKQGWIEYFALLRYARRHDDALALAERAALQFGEDALPAALRGAALVELGRFREGLAALDDAARQNPDLAMVWHEAGYAAWRLGELSRALMALDRAFALEPHGGTLHLRGKVLRQAGRYLAAEVSFEGAAQAAEFAIQREAAEREIRVTQRYAAFPGSKPDTLPPLRRWFADTGSAPLTGHTGNPATDEQIVDAFACLARDLEWHFSVVVALDGWKGWDDLAARLGIPVATTLPADPNAIPLVVVRDPTAQPLWEIQARAPAERGRGASLALRQPAGLTPADILGYLAEVPPHGIDLPFATEGVQHPAASLHGRVMG